GPLSVFFVCTLCLFLFPHPLFFFLFLYPPTTDTHTLSLHDALPICLAYSLKDADAAVKDEIQSIMRSVDGAIKDVRKYIMRLKEPTQEASLDEQLHLFVRELQREARIPVRIKTEPVEGGLISAEAMMDILLIVREAVSNAVRHARASEIRITLVRDERGINLSIVDDGIGFDPDAPRPKSAGEHLGLDNMRRRADSLGGHLSIHSEPGHGTEILLRIPCHQ